jgi:ribosome-associated protein
MLDVPQRRQGRPSPDPPGCPHEPQPNPMKLDQFLKFQGLVGTGGEAKQRIQAGDIKVNGVVETRRGRQLATGDAVELDGRELLVLPQRRAGDPQPGER